MCHHYQNEYEDAVDENNCCIIRGDIVPEVYTVDEEGNLSKNKLPKGALIKFRRNIRWSGYSDYYKEASKRFGAWNKTNKTKFCQDIAMIGSVQDYPKGFDLVDYDISSSYNGESNYVIIYMRVR